jgi:hypothetical protein
MGRYRMECCAAGHFLTLRAWPLDKLSRPQGESWLISVATNLSILYFCSHSGYSDKLVRPSLKKLEGIIFFVRFMGRLP